MTEDNTMLEMLELADLQESSLLDNGSYDLEIVAASQKDGVEWTDKDGVEHSASIINVTLVAAGEEDKHPVYHSMFKPNPDENDPMEDVKRQRSIAGFLKKFDIAAKKAAYADFIGKTANVRTYQKLDKDGETRVNVKIPRF